MRKLYTITLLLLTSIGTWAQGPNGTGTYYQSADGKSGQALKTALFEIIKNPDVDTYDQLWTDYKYTDRREDGLLWDMYSNITDFVIGGDKQGVTISGEGSSYNREHSLPKSWFSSEAPMYSDAMHVVPVDGRTNSMRNNFPYGPNNADKNKSANGFSKLGTCTYPGYTKTVFEPNDEYKGDLARIYFYMMTCYEDNISQWSSVSNGVDEIFSNDAYSPFNSWVMQMLMEWAENDPISQKEIDRNNVVYKIQGNRNPFIDFPGLEKYIWGDKTTATLDYDSYDGATYGGAVIMENDEPFNPEGEAASTTTQKYQKVDWNGEVEPGSRYILVYQDADVSRAMGAVTKIGSAPVREYIDVTIDGETVETEVSSTGKPYEFVIGGKRGEYTLYDPAAMNYISINSDANQLHTTTDATTDNAKWTIKFSKGTVLIRNKAFDRGIYYNRSTPRFASYGGPSSYVAAAQLYKNTTATPTTIHAVTTTTGRGYNVYSVQGTMVRTCATYQDAVNSLPRGIYIVNGRKVVVK